LEEKSPLLPHKKNQAEREPKKREEATPLNQSRGANLKGAKTLRRSV